MATPTLVFTAFGLLSALLMRALPKKTKSSLQSQSKSKQSLPLVESIETPALLVDLDILEANVATMANMLQNKYPKIALRVHGKASKCPTLVKYQVKKIYTK